MSTPPAPDQNNPRRGSFGQPPSQPDAGAPTTPPQRRQRYQAKDEDESLGEMVAEEVADALDLNGRALGCAWWTIRLPFRVIWKLIDAVTDLF